MGRQVQFHMLPEDSKAFLDFVQGRDPVVVTFRSSDSPEIKEVTHPSSETDIMTLWNQSLLVSLEREHIVYPGRSYYGINASLPTLEFLPSEPCTWNGRAALLQGRLYGFFDRPFPEYIKWYKSLARWIRSNLIRNPLPVGGYVGPAAYEWYKKGGLLLPMFRPPLTSKWLSWVEAQDQHRAVFAK